MGWLARQFSRFSATPEADHETVIERVKEIRQRSAEDCRALDAVIADLSALLSKQKASDDAKST